MAFAPRTAFSTAVATAVLTPSLERSPNGAAVSIIAIPANTGAMLASTRKSAATNRLKTRIIHLL